MRHSRIKYCKSNESISFEKMIFSPRGKCAFFALKIISIFLILLLTFISWTSVLFSLCQKYSLSSMLLCCSSALPNCNVINHSEPVIFPISVRVFAHLKFQFSFFSRLANSPFFSYGAQFTLITSYPASAMTLRTASLICASHIPHAIPSIPTVILTIKHPSLLSG